MAGKHGVRLNKRQAESTRAKIQTSQIINRLSKHIDGEVKMSSTQVRAAEILLKKALPDLKSSEHTGKDGKDLFPQKIEMTGVKADTKA